MKFRLAEIWSSLVRTAYPTISPPTKLHSTELPFPADREAQKLGIIVALPVECASLGARLKQKGDIAELSPTVQVILSGAGPDNARLAAEMLIKQGATALLSWGCCAALTPNLHPGDLILPEALWLDGISYATDTTWRKNWLKALLPALTWHGGLLAQSSGIVADFSAKQALALQSGALAVDMESAAVAQVAQAHGLPCMVVRAVADPLDFALPACVLENTDSDGITHIAGLLFSLLQSPGQLLHLLALSRHFTAAMNTLANALYVSLKAEHYR